MFAQTLIENLTILSGVVPPLPVNSSSRSKSAALTRKSVQLGRAVLPILEKTAILSGVVLPLPANSSVDE
jgi:hypothetical protein